ncbi:MAG: bifunctional glutamate N-acetyltransferase/amino-acid acetyltransferase ArgJ [Lachnospiraceae bacterium]|nr:bifunctional glutamate N-acetyltransferase/amino-acid acetyltransferase ArgJ [Lachnospiraceae bacterium]
MKEIEGGILAAEGYCAASMCVGVKPNATKRDLTMIKSEMPATVVGVFTRNKVKAAPVKWDMEVVAHGLASAVVVNTGIANAATGKQGLENCKIEAEAVAEALGVSEKEVLVGSTGVIGPQLPMDKITGGIKELAGKLVSAKDGADVAKAEAHEAALAIMTTDTQPKEIAVSFEINGVTCKIGAMCKGSGMIHPNMGTMLGYLLSDLSIDHELAQKLLRAVVERTFNMVSVDGDTSTNDTVLWLCNGLSGNEKITAATLGISLDDIDESGDTDMSTLGNEAYRTLYRALYTVCLYLAKNIAKDGEGATRLFTAKVIGAPDYETAKTLAKSVITSSLTKAAIYGRDANCGRIFCAMGYSGAEFDPDKVDITMSSKEGSITMIEQGMLPEFSEEEALKILTPDEITAVCDLHAGSFEAEAWGCDLTHEYVTINADYRS